MIQQTCSFISPKEIVCSTRVETEMCDGDDVRAKKTCVVSSVEIVPKDNIILGGSYVAGFYPGKQSVYHQQILDGSAKSKK